MLCNVICFALVLILNFVYVGRIVLCGFGLLVCGDVLVCCFLWVCCRVSCVAFAGWVCAIGLRGLRCNSSLRFVLHLISFCLVYVRV